jgi:hypothetical protein
MKFCNKIRHIKLNINGIEMIILIKANINILLKSMIKI